MFYNDLDFLFDPNADVSLLRVFVNCFFKSFSLFMHRTGEEKQIPAVKFRRVSKHVSRALQ